MLVKPDFRGDGIGGGDPMEGGLNLASVGRVAAFCRGVIGATKCGYFA